jgi:hypothetical protein
MPIRKSEQIQLIAKTHSYFPASFRWRGRRFDVIAVEKCWTVSSPTAQRLFRVRCQGGCFVLQHSVANGQWKVRSWPLTLWMPRLRRPAPPRYPLPRHQRRPVTRPWPRAVAAPPVSLQAQRADAAPLRAASPVPVPVKTASMPRKDLWTATLHRT